MLQVDCAYLEDKTTLTNQLKSQITNPVFLCIGTDKVFSDSLGPKVGTLLNDKMTKPCFVYGNCNTNVTAENLLCWHSVIKQLHPNSQIVVIDAAVGTSDQIGKVQLTSGGIVPGSATNKNLPNIGDIGIIGIVAHKGMQDFYTTNTSKLQLVNKVANFIADAIVNSF